MIGLEGLVNYLGEMVSNHEEMLCDLGVIVPALDEHCPRAFFLLNVLTVVNSKLRT